MTERQLFKTIYWAWKAMKQRCQNPKCQAYKNYGARGISVCEEWQKFEPFLEWSKKSGYEKGLDLDRIDNNGNYEPGNCRWATRRENSNNTRFTVKICVDGETKNASDWELQLGIKHGLVSYWRRKHGDKYAANRIKETIKNGYRVGDYGYSHRKRIAHESGKEFVSVRECAKAFGLSPCTISNAIREGRRTSKGLFYFV